MPTPIENSFQCPHCQTSCTLLSSDKPRFCPSCGQSVNITASTAPSQSQIIESIGPYQLLKGIGKGGMGEVFLAYDTSCGRQIALKRIRPDLIQHPQIYNRFLKEARVTCQLTHPAIIPIYTIYQGPSSTYYTMPFVEGETLKQIIRKTRQQDKKGETLDHIGGSIPALIRIFLTICQAVAYAHSKGVLHRDLKPENIIIGTYGQVLILDWGLAKHLNSRSDDTDDTFPLQELLPQEAEITRTGKVVGTIAYMAPERALGQPATIQTDIYSLGVILYQLLTLRPPFKRSTLDEMKKNLSREELIDPIVMAPYRDISRVLSRITQKCLEKEIAQRYNSVDELIRDVENYVEGRSEWFTITTLDIKNKEDWEFQENVLVAEHMAITRLTEEAEWVSLMISRSSFTGNTKLEVDVCLGEEGHGIGFLISVPEMAERLYIHDGYCLWLGSDINRSTRLLRSSIDVMQAPDIFLKRHQWYRIRIEKIEQTLHLYINDRLQFSYIAHIPLIGTHIGVLSRDANFEIRPLEVSVGSLNIMVNCLAVPDAFLAHKDFVQALSEYRRIAYSFPDRAEGREALFRAGLTFIEQAKESLEKKELLDLALDEFERLHNTPGAPLEYLGKALVYQALDDYEEEIKCFELAYRRYPRHPLLAILQEQIISRMHEMSRLHRKATYNFVLLAVRHLPMSTTDTHTRKLFSSIQRHWEPLPFIESPSPNDPVKPNDSFAVQLAFWLAKPYILEEIIEELAKREEPVWIEIENALFSLIELGAWDYAAQKIQQLRTMHATLPLSALHALELIQQAILCHSHPIRDSFDYFFNEPFIKLNFKELRVFLYLLDEALDRGETVLVHEAIERLEQTTLSTDIRIELDLRSIWAYFLDKNWTAAGAIIYSYPIEQLNKESSPLYFLYGCWLKVTEGTEMALIHFSGVLDVSFPRTGTLASHYLVKNITPEDPWFNKAFLWEKRKIYQQLSLYYRCAEENEKEEEFKTLYRQQFIHV